MYQVNPPSIDEATGEVTGEAQVFSRDHSRHELTATAEDIDPSEYNDALAPHYARKAAEANLPIFQEGVSDEAVVAFWKSNRPLTDAEVDAIQAAYVATDNDDIANLLQYRLTGDTSFLNEQQLEELGLTESESEVVEEETTDEMSAEDLTDYIYNEAAEPNEAIADAILDVDLGDSDAASVVQYLSYKYFTGELSVDDAYNQALDSGIDPDELTTAFNQLRKHFN
jgi:hypothetical protein